MEDDLPPAVLAALEADLLDLGCPLDAWLAWLVLRHPEVLE